MKQVLRKGPGQVIVDVVPDPLPTPHHVVIQPVCSLISSGTESASIHRESLVRLAAEKPEQLRAVWEALTVAGPRRTFAEVRAKFSEYSVLGYSGVGVVVSKHPTVEDLEIGDRVAYGGEGTGHCEYVLAGRNLVARVPDGVSWKAASFTTLGSIAMNATRIAGVGVGDVVAIIGMGLVGQLVSQLVQCQGGRVFAIDLKPERLELARSLGAEATMLGEDMVRDSIMALTSGKGVDRVILAAAAKSNTPCLQALALLRDRGRVVVVGAVDLSFPWLEMYLKEVELRMARAYGPGSYDPNYEERGQDYPYAYVRWTEGRNMAEFLRLVAAQRVHPEGLITHQFPLEQATMAYETILDPSSKSLAVLLEYPEPADSKKTFTPRTSVNVIAPSTPEPGTIGVALVGAGHLARWAHLPNLKRIPGTQLRWICSASGARGKNYAVRFAANYATSDYNEALADPAVGAVIVTSRNQHHAAQAVAALEAGKHVFVEKPLALTREECRAVYRALATSRRCLSVGFNRRFAPFYVQQKEIVSRRKGPAVINCRVNSPGISGPYWMADPSIGGAILGEACHFIDLMYWFLESEPLRVSCYSLPTGDDEPVGENNVAASFFFADGSVGNLTYCTVGSKNGGGERVEVFAPGFTVACEDFKRLEVVTRGRSRKSSWTAQKGYAAQLKDFFASIREGRPPAVTVGDGIRSTIACLAMVESARTADPCEIQWQKELVQDAGA